MRFWPLDSSYLAAKWRNRCLQYHCHGLILNKQQDVLFRAFACLSVCVRDFVWCVCVLFDNDLAHFEQIMFFQTHDYQL